MSSTGKTVAGAGALGILALFGSCSKGAKVLVKEENAAAKALSKGAILGAREYNKNNKQQSPLFPQKKE